LCVIYYSDKHRCEIEIIKRIENKEKGNHKHVDKTTTTKH
jgi:hypothetical protein